MRWKKTKKSHFFTRVKLINVMGRDAFSENCERFFIPSENINQNVGDDFFSVGDDFERTSEKIKGG